MKARELIFEDVYEELIIHWRKHNPKISDYQLRQALYAVRKGKLSNGVVNDGFSSGFKLTMPAVLVGKTDKQIK